MLTSGKYIYIYIYVPSAKPVHFVAVLNFVPNISDVLLSYHNYKKNSRLKLPPISTSYDSFKFTPMSAFNVTLIV